MNTYELPFGKVIKIDDTVFEVIVNEGIEMDSEMVDQFHNCLIENASAPFGILVNKINEYTYTFRAQIKLATIPQIRAIAAVTYSSISAKITESIGRMPRKVDWNLKIFDNRRKAIDWLHDELVDVPTMASDALEKIAK